jgi:hypothetical protein
MLRCTRSVMICGLALQVALTARANPSQETPDAPLDVAGLVKSDVLLKQAKELMDLCSKTIPNLAKEVERGPHQLMRRQQVALRQLRRLALDLEIHGETAGYDYSLRVAKLEPQLNNAIGRFQATRAGLDQAAKVRQFLAQPKSSQARTAAVQRIGQLLQQQKFEEAYQLLNDFLDDLISYTMFLPPSEPRPFPSGFAELEHQVTVRRHTLVRQQVQEALEQVVIAQLPKPQALVAAVAAAATGLRSAPGVDVGGKTLSGPQCLEYFGGEWKRTQLAAVRCRAIEWARRVTLADYMYLPRIQAASRIVDADYERFGEEMNKALATLIEADGARAAGPDAAALYAAYLQTAAPLVSATADDKLGLALAPALEKLAAKSPAFAADVASYRAATDECLRWRERVAKSAAAGRQKPFTPSGQLMLQAMNSREGFDGLLARDNPKIGEAHLIGSCPEVLAGAAPKIVSQQVLVDNAVGLPGGKYCVTPYQQRHYAMLPRLPFDREIETLKQELLISEQGPPLTLQAAVAIDSAQQGTLLTVGGVVKDVFLEGLIPRFAKLPEAAAPLVPLGPLPDEPPTDRLLNHVLVRLNVTPSWVRHRYFFVDLSPSAAATAAK